MVNYIWFFGYDSNALNMQILWKKFMKRKAPFMNLRAYLEQNIRGSGEFMSLLLSV